MKAAAIVDAALAEQDQQPRFPEIRFEGPVAFHDQCCAVYFKRPAVFEFGENTFHPSWRAQREGWQLLRAKTWWQRFALWLFFPEAYYRLRFAQHFTKDH